ncbi:DUF922 domain-containing protein [Aquimarina sediminis]|uniref:DUF922 domain-containing protein n=1 Tax=Aquimarina sediminis TaxID=2070536 RepID=UPI000CA058B4|nr:hypothetical protein [Aquimarina sediminis]
MIRLLCITFLYTSLIFGQKDIQVSPNIIQWEKGVFLKPSDFKINKDVDPFKVKNALTTYKIEILPKEVIVDEKNNIVNYLKMNLATYFYKKKSWLGNKKDPKHLAHEQLHFDIAELFARKMRKAFKELKNKRIKNFDDYQKVYNKYWKACKTYQNTYDRETFNGSMPIPSNDWLLKVDKELYELEEYTYKKVKSRWRERMKKS